MEKGKEKQKVNNPSVFLSAALMSLGTLSSRILGLVRDILLGAFFGRTVTDAFTVAFRLPNMFRRLLGEGSLAVSFIPVYLDRLEAEGEEESRRFSGAIYSLLMVVVSALSVLGIIFMEPMIGSLVSGKGFVAVEGKVSLTVTLAQIMFSYLFLVTNYAFFTALLNAHKSFFLPAMGPTLFNLIFIIFAVVPGDWLQFSGQNLALGVLFGGVFQMGLVALAAHRQSRFPRFCWAWRLPGVRVVLLNMIPGMIGMGILQLMALVNVNYASRLPEGSHSYIYWADRILELPQSLIAISLGAALLPTLSQLSSRNKMDEMRRVTQKYQRVFLTLAIPSAVGMFVLAQPMVEVLFMRGQFTAYDAKITSGAIQVYAFLLVGSGITKVTVPSFFAIKNTWLPAIVSGCSLMVHIILAPHLMDAYGLNGLVGSTMFTGLLNAFIILVCFRAIIGALDIGLLLVTAAKVLVAAMVMGFIAHSLYPFGNQLLALLLPVSMARGMALFATIVVCIVTYFLCVKLLKVPEVDEATRRWRRK